MSSTRKEQVIFLKLNLDFFRKWNIFLSWAIYNLFRSIQPTWIYSTLFMSVFTIFAKKFRTIHTTTSAVFLLHKIIKMIRDTGKYLRKYQVRVGIMFYMDSESQVKLRNSLICFARRNLKSERKLRIRKKNFVFE